MYLTQCDYTAFIFTKVYTDSTAEKSTLVFPDDTRLLWKQFTDTGSLPVQRKVETAEGGNKETELKSI